MASYAFEQSTWPITMRFRDESGKEVPPDSVKWTLVDEAGNVVNNREQVEVSEMASRITIVLSGDDLMIINPKARYEKRFVVVEATYSSTTVGVGAPLNQEYEFYVTNIRYVT